MPGAGSSTISKKLAKKLKLGYFSPGEFFKSHAKGKEVERAIKVFKSGKGKKKEFHKLIDDMQIKKAKKGNIVICGKLSIYMLKDIADYKIWLDCSLDERANRTAERDKISVKDAKKKISEREKLEVEEWKRDYGIDYRDQKKIADIIIDSTNLTEIETLNEILKKMRV